ncbi:MAG: hypothetical protein J2P15_01575 [Micromonosporaceae bacterium]|nr:hypothetical protein [Micromonosporaceae bacterium]
MTEHAHWRREFVEAELRTNRFRADNCYLWQLRSMGESARLKYYLYARYLAATGGDELLSTLGEDGAFGAIAFQYATAPTLSRDLLDSVGELLFLDRQWGLRDRTGFSVVDIGAGYGRMAHRMGQAMSGLERYYCLDAVPESTFVCDWYLRFRGIDRAASVPLDELGSLDGTSPELAIATHSLSEMPFRAVQAWIHWLAEHEVDSLLVVPNENNRLLSLEGPGVRGDCSPLLARFGYWLRVDEPVICDPDIRALTGVYERFLLFERAR